MSGRYVLQGVSEESYKEFYQTLLDSTGTFHLILSSPGGDTDAMWAFHDTILCTKRRIVGTAVGFCHSAAPLILAACDVRQCTPNTEFMVHEDICRVKGAPSKALQELSRHQAAEDKWYTAMSLLTGKTINEWRVLSESDAYFNSHQAKEYGVVDKILSINRGLK